MGLKEPKGAKRGQPPRGGVVSTLLKRVSGSLGSRAGLLAVYASITLFTPVISRQPSFPPSP